MSFSDNLDALMVQFGVNQEQVAKAAGVSPAAVTGWRKGSNPRRGALENLCSHFGISEDDLLSESYGLGSSSPSSSYNRTDTTQQVALFESPIRQESSKNKPLGRIIVPGHVVHDKPHVYAAIAHDEGMNRIIPPGSHVLIDPDDHSPENGSIIAFSVIDTVALQELGMLWGCSQTLFRYWYKGARTLMLSPDSYDSKQNDLLITSDEVDQTIEIIGSVIWYQSPSPLA